jgi:putative phosphoribosyl transferase
LHFESFFKDRRDAGEKLAAEVAMHVHGPDLLVLGLPRGGVPVAFEIARALRAELDVFLVRKLGLPGHEELAVGAIASGGVRVLNESILRELRVSPQLIERIAGREQRELERREELYRKCRPPVQIDARIVILIDDGLATGASMKAAAQAVRVQNPKQVIAAVPVAAKEVCKELREHVDEVICLFTPRPFLSVSTWYEQFSQTTDEEVRHLLDEAARQNRI